MTDSISKTLQILFSKVAFIFLLFNFSEVHSQELIKTLSSPDGKLSVNVLVKNGTASYSVSYKGKV